LHRVAANLVIDGGRRRTVFGRIAGRLVDRGQAPPPEEALLGWEFRKELHDALGGLSVEARTALLLAAHGFTGREIATALGRTELATRSLMWRARTELRDRLTGWEARP
jgi:DNA-directed RNA polymerase specialized sigma24 family protein